MVNRRGDKKVDSGRERKANRNGDNANGPDTLDPHRRRGGGIPLRMVYRKRVKDKAGDIHSDLKSSNSR